MIFGLFVVGIVCFVIVCYWDFVLLELFVIVILSVCCLDYELLGLCVIGNLYYWLCVVMGFCVNWILLY